MKGLSQVITSALILAIGVAVASIYGSWAPEFAGNVSERTANQQNEDLRCSNAALRINSAVYDLTANFTEIEVTNVGTIDLRSGLTAVTFNQSRITGRTNFDRIEVDSTRVVSVDGDEIPEEAAVLTDECGEEVNAYTRNIEID